MYKSVFNGLVHHADPFLFPKKYKKIQKIQKIVKKWQNILNFLVKYGIIVLVFFRRLRVIMSAIENEKQRILVEDLYEKYNRRIFRIAMSILHNKFDAEDAVNDTVKKIIENLDKYERADDLYTAKMITLYSKHAAIAIYRRNKKKTALPMCVYSSLNTDECEEIDFIDEDAFIDTIMMKKELVEEVNRIIGLLPDSYREILDMKYNRNMKNRQIARVLNISETMVSTRLYVAKKKILLIGGARLYAFKD